jgi:beta-glucosidase
MIKKTSDIVNNLSLKEKSYILTGKSFWEICVPDRFSIPTIIVSDGPHGLRRVVNVSEDKGNGESIKAICFPTASAQACSFDEEILFKLGSILGEECQAENIQVLLGPANNIKRTPLCGRNFEYYSEDPYLAGKLSTAFIKGVQSRGVGTSLKHFVANNQEKRRMTINSIIDERTLREIYLGAFEEPIIEGKPWTIMGSYNKVNGSYVCQNEYLLQQVLRKEWKYDGVVLSDWGAVDQLHESIQNGLDLEMPTSGNVGPEKIIKGFKKGILSLDRINASVTNVIQLLEKANSFKMKDSSFNKEEHHLKAREIGRECIVLLKNEQNILPLTSSKYKSIALIGDFVMNPRFQGGGSSHINPYKVDNLFDEFQKSSNDYKITYARGFDRNQDETNESLLIEAKSVASTSDIILLLVGLPDRYETEGIDRKHLNLPPNQLSLIEEISKNNSNVVVILSIGSCVKLPFVSKVKGLICSWLLGEAGAGSIYDILTGLSNPSGKLAESFIKNEKDDPSFGNYPGDHEVVYKEGVFVGYRYHDQFNKDIEFEFGFGLSYTEFEYSDLKISKDNIKDDEEVNVSFRIKNIGSFPGKEIVQLYIRENIPIIERPPKELKRFKKVFLNTQEEIEIEFTLNKRSFAYYNVYNKDWVVNSGEFTILIGKSSRNIILDKTIHVQSTIKSIIEEKVKTYDNPTKKSKKINRNTPMEELKNHPIGISMYRKMEKEMNKRLSNDNENAVMDSNSTVEFLNNMPLRGLVNLSQGKGLSERSMNLLIFFLNRTRKNTILGKFLITFLKT